MPFVGVEIDFVFSLAGDEQDVICARLISSPALPPVSQGFPTSAK